MEAAAGVIASLIFAAYALVALAGGLAVLLARRPETALRGLLVSLLAGTCAYVQMMAPMVAAVQLVALAGVAIAALRVVTAGDEARPWQRWGAVAAGLVGLAALVLLLVGTWARQYVWTGRELAPGSNFGSAAALGLAWSESHAPTLLAALLAVLLLAIVTAAEREHRL